jgi:hypothetical protein
MNNKPQRCTRLQSQILLLGEEFECPLPLRERLGLAANENVSSGRGLLRLKNQGSSSPQVNVAYGRGLLRLEKNPLPEAKGGVSANNNHTPRRQSFLQAMEALGITSSENKDLDDTGDDEEQVSDDNESVSDEGEEIEGEEGDIPVFLENGKLLSFHYICVLLINFLLLLEESEESSDEAEETVGELENASGIIYSLNTIPAALRRRNILTQRPRTLANPTIEVNSFKLFHTQEMTSLIMRETNRKVRAINKQGLRKIASFTENEILAALSILLRAGVDRDNYTSLNQLWKPSDSRPFYRATMGIVRFKQFLRCIRFDNIFTREERRDSDCLAAISDIWMMFHAQLRLNYIPDSDITVDEQLVGYRGRAPGRTYLPSKPSKYGVKIFWASEAKTGFALSAKIYSGKPKDQEIERELGKKVVLQLTEPFFNSGRNIVTDNYFTSHSLAVELIKKNLTLLGTIRKHRKEIPTYLRNTRHLDQFTSRFVFDHENAITMVTYIPRKYRSVVLLSSSHFSAEIDDSQDRSKPMMILDYNKCKGGVDTLDENIEEFTCRRKTTRWPLLLYFNILDVATFNAFLLMRANGYSKSRAEFIRNLTLQLATALINERVLAQRTSRDAKECAAVIGIHAPATVVTLGEPTTCNPGRCRICGKNARSRCNVCGKPCCTSHRISQNYTRCTSCAL